LRLVFFASGPFVRTSGIRQQADTIELSATNAFPRIAQNGPRFSHFLKRRYILSGVSQLIFG